MNILLVCAAGMSTSLLVNRMNEAAAAKGIELHIEAHSVLINMVIVQMLFYLALK